MYKVFNSLHTCMEQLYKKVVMFTNFYTKMKTYELKHKGHKLLYENNCPKNSCLLHFPFFSTLILSVVLFLFISFCAGTSVIP